MYRVSYDPDAWVRVSSGAPEWRQTIEQPLGNGLHLVATLVRGFGGQPRVVAALVEHRYRTRYEWKRRTVKRVSPNDVAVEAVCPAHSG